jgi:hypothetical protein
MKTPPLGFSLDNKKSDPISNLEMLSSYARFGVWLRHGLAFQQLNKLQTSTDWYERLLATATFYSALGALIEDVAATLLAFMTLEKNGEVRLADILYQTSFTKDKKAIASKAYVEQIVLKLAAGERAKVDIICLAESLRLWRPQEVLFMLGLPWNKNPSVKLVRTDREREFWMILPESLKRNIIERLGSPEVLRLCIAYNKIKHGPQLVLTDLQQFLNALAGGGLGKEVSEVSDKIKDGGQSTETLRILFEGANTALASDASSPPTMFLDDHAYIVGHSFESIIHPLAKTMFQLANWIGVRKFKLSWFNPPEYFNRSDDFVWKQRAESSLQQACIPCRPDASCRS